MFGGCMSGSVSSRKGDRVSASASPRGEYVFEDTVDEESADEEGAGFFATPSRQSEERVSAGASSDYTEQRYGLQKRKWVDQRIGWISGILIVAAAVAVFCFSGFNPSNSDISVRDISHAIEGEQSAKLVYELNVTPGKRASCVIKALTKSHGIAGYHVVQIPASDQRTRILTQTLVTVAPATTITAEQCRILNDVDAPASTES